MDVYVTQVHNSILQSLVTWGAVGALVFWTLVLMACWRIFIRARANPVHFAPYVMGVLCILCYSMMDATLYYSYPLLFMTVLVSGIFATPFRK